MKPRSAIDHRDATFVVLALAGSERLGRLKAGLQTKGFMGLQKCLRSLEMGRSGLGGDGPAKRERIGTEIYGDPRHPPARRHQPQAEHARRRTNFLHPPRAPRRLHHRRGFNLTKIDRWFLTQIKEIVDFEEELATAKN